MGCASSGLRPISEAPRSDALSNVTGEQLYQHGLALAQHGDLVRAEQYLSASIKRGYPEEQALPALMRVCLSANHLGAALQYALPYLRLHPEDAELRFVVSSVQLALGNPDLARKELDRVIEQKPEHAGAHYLRGVVARDHFDDADAAARDFERYVALEQDGLHSAEVKAWLREHREQADAPPRMAAPAPRRIEVTR